MTEIAVITPYAGQVAVLRRRLPPAVEVNTVNAFQVRARFAVTPQFGATRLRWHDLPLGNICHLPLGSGALVISL